MDQELPLESKDFDYVILGTGLTESLVSAALSRIGKTVLHLDENTFYGASSGSLTLDSLNDFLTDIEQKSKTEKDTLVPFEWQESTPINKLGPKDVRSVAHVDVPARPEGTEDMTKDSHASRRCSIDLNPKLIWSRSLVIDTLIRAGSARHLEFKTVQHLYIQSKEFTQTSVSSASSSNDSASLSTPALVRVPVSKADVFKSTDISLIEKRQLMKFITTISSPDEDEKALLKTFADKPFSEYCKHKKIGQNLAQFLMYAIAFESHVPTSPLALTTQQGVDGILHFMGSLGRYGGNSPWIYPLFGMGDLSQSFCRLSAVYGGTFILGQRVSEINVQLPAPGSGEKPLITSVHVGVTKDLKCKHLITNVDHVPELIMPLDYSSSSSAAKSLSRCVLITDKPLKTAEKTKEILLTVIPPGMYQNSNAVYMFQLDESASVVPADRYLIHIWTEGSSSAAASSIGGVKTAKEDLEAVVKAFTTPSNADPIEAFSAQTPNILYVAYFSHVQRQLRSDVAMPSNLTVINDLDFELGADCFFRQAQRLFEQLCPNEEFIPNVPNPEDIIWTGDDAEGAEGTEGVDGTEM